MKNLIILFSLAALMAATVSCSKHPAQLPTEPQYVTVKDGEFYIGDSVYRFAGANFWYGAILGSEGQGGDRARLARELDILQELGVDNLRVLVGGDGEVGITSHIRPVLQTAPGVYNDTILDGLDYLMAELEKRDMKAILYLNNAWEWSGGYSAYLEWAGAGHVPDPNTEGYQQYVEKVSEFVRNDSAKAMALNHVKYIVGRENRYTGQPYTQSPALMTWEIANEPRAFASDSVTKALFKDWVLGTAREIKQLDPNHLVSTGSEGLYGCQSDLQLWADLHNAPEIDYAIIHLWPSNWGWVTGETAADSTEVALKLSREYIDMHVGLTDKPLVLEEFGYPRDGRAFSIDSPVTGRDKFYKGIYDMIKDGDKVQGSNFWAWGGDVNPPHDTWQPWDPYTGDPAQEPQGLYSVFATDSTTIQIIKNAIQK